MKLVLSAFLFCCSILGYADKANTLTVDINKPQFVVPLPANPTTGYQWKLTNMDKALLHLVSSNYIAPQTKLIGSGGTMQFIFALLTTKGLPHTTQLTFVYARPWDAKNGKEKQVTIQFKK